MLNVIEYIPDGLLTTPPTELYKIIDGPTLVHLPGERENPLFVSVLLHGNETTGYFAIQELLKKYQGSALPRSLSIFFGNVQAARYAARRLDNQVDYNRIWPHTDFTPEAQESAIMRQVVEEMKARNVFVSIDIHNNTGLNPHYACINKLENAFYQLAILFSRTVIYFIRPQGVQSQAFAEICPAITIECGKTEHRHGITHATELIESCLNLSALPEQPVLKQDIDLFHTVAIVKVKPEVDFSFTDSHTDVCFRSDLEKLNFCELPASTGIGDVKKPDLIPFQVTDENANNVYEKFFKVDNHRLVTNCDIMPSMLTTESDIIRKDCLCYLMERISIE
jgi:hypothetical protein